MLVLAVMVHMLKYAPMGDRPLFPTQALCRLLPTLNALGYILLGDGYRL